MSDSTFGWRGAKMKHEDGRTGIIKRESFGLSSVFLTILVDGTKEEEILQLNSRGKDTGAKGWHWNYAREGKPEAWALLGDHNTKGE